jgi:hypothetical protein
VPAFGRNAFPPSLPYNFTMFYVHLNLKDYNMKLQSSQNFQFFYDVSHPTYYRKLPFIFNPELENINEGEGVEPKQCKIRLPHIETIRSVTYFSVAFRRLLCNSSFAKTYTNIIFIRRSFVAISASHKLIKSLFMDATSFLPKRFRVQNVCTWNIIYMSSKRIA